MHCREIKTRGAIRSLADALSAALAAGVLRDGETAQLRTMGLEFPDGRLTGFGTLSDAHQQDGPTWYLGLPKSARFRARTSLGEQLDYPIWILNRAMVTTDGDVQLQSDEWLHAIDFIPGAPLYEQSSREKAIVLAVLASLDKLDECWTEIYGDVFPGHRALRCDKISEVRVKDFKILHHEVNGLLREPVSQSVMCKALAAAGMQMPRSKRAA